MTDAFWVGGCQAIEEALRLEYDALLQDLRTQSEQCIDEVSCVAIEDKLRATEAEYHMKLKDVKRCLF